jgi:gliding motility-associated-like protein
LVNAGPDLAACIGDTAWLTGSGIASSWVWSPATFLSAPTSLSTLAFPTSSQLYILRGTDTLGCPKPSFDSVFLSIIPPVPAFAGNDTAVVVNQPLQLTGRGATFYQWFPSAFLSSDTIANPIALFTGTTDNFRYIMRATTPEGCIGFDTINVRIFRTGPEIFGPTAFTPDGNNLNDLFRPVVVGFEKFDYFRVFNRWGQEIYSTQVPGEGWNGIWKGQVQPPGTYAWMVSGTDYLGNVVQKKGTMVLIR